MLSADISPSEIFALIGNCESELTQGLAPKALIRNFVHLLARVFSVREVAVCKIDKRGDTSDFLVKFDGLTEVPAVVMQEIKKLIQESSTLAAQLSEGACYLEVSGMRYSATLIVAAEANGTVLLVWDAFQEHAIRSDLEQHLAHVFLNEARWFSRLERTEHLLYQDDLTGLFNSRYLELAIDQELRRSGRSENPFCLMFIDLDGFKGINDQYGHPVGSQVLKQVAVVIRDAVREVDIPIRYGGDEFVVILVGASASKGYLAAERLRRRIAAASFRVDDRNSITVNLTASIGLAAYPDHARDRESLIKVADDTMYNSKKRGKNRVTILTREGTVQ